MVRIGTDTTTENTFIADKVHLRNLFMPGGEVVNVLDAFSADGLIWKALVKMNPRTDFRIARIDQARNKKGFYVRSENMRFLRSTDLDAYDVIDLDHYGIPFHQLELVLQHHFLHKVVVFASLNLVGIMPLHIRMLELLGYSRNMIDTSRYLCSTNVEKKILGYLNMRGVKEVNKISFNNKTGYHLYLHFTIGEQNV
jgi:hypothetical protein